MTAQTPDVLYVGGERMALLATPLESYFGEDRPRPPFWSSSTADWRGYVATWEIEADTLFLLSVDGFVNRPKTERPASRVPDPVPLSRADLFPGHRARVEASWFAGRLRAAKGRIIRYVHMGFWSAYEQEILFDLEGGRVRRTQTIDASRGRRCDRCSAENTGGAVACRTCGHYLLGTAYLDKEIYERISKLNRVP